MGQEKGIGECLTLRVEQRLQCFASQAVEMILGGTGGDTSQALGSWNRMNIWNQAVRLDTQG